MLRAPKAISLFRRVHCRKRTVRPGQPPFAGFVERTIAIGRDCKKPGVAFDHHIAYVSSRWSDEADAATGDTFRGRSNIFCAGACLSRAAPAEVEPYRPPVARRGELLGACGR